MFEEEKLKVSGYEKLYKEENIFEFENKIIIRFECSQNYH